MPKYIIERQLPGASALTPEQLQEIARKSVAVLTRMGPSIQWVQTFIATDALYCIYIAPNEQAVREHANCGGFPVTRISEVVGVFDPTTADVPVRA